MRVVIDNGEEKELREYTVDDLRLKPRQKKDVKLTEEELRELKDLEDSGDETMEDKSQEKPQKKPWTPVTTKMNIASAVISVTTEKDVRTGRT